MLDVPPTFAAQAGTFSEMVACKSFDLFENRLVCRVARRHLDPSAYCAWLQQALVIQQAIYLLDDYYENSRSIVAESTAPIWARVSQLLPSESVRQSSFVWSGFADLRRYGIDEGRIHVFDPIDPREFRTIVHHKCADVRIARGLIWTFNPRRLNSRFVRFWELFDQCSELIEDIQDLGEDGRDWNFNFWLYPYMAGHSLSDAGELTSRLLRVKLYALECAFAAMSAEDQAAWQFCLRKVARDGARALASLWPLFRFVSRSHVITFADLAVQSDRVAA